MLLKKYAVRPSRDSNAIALSYTDPDPQFSVAMTNALVQAYIDTTLELRVEPAKQYNAFFDERARQMRDALEQAQTKLSVYQRKNGVLISQDDGEAVTYSLGKLDDRGRMFVKAGDPLYEGMIIGIHSRDNDLVVNAVRGKQLTNFRVSGKEDAIKITPPIQLTLEYAVEFIADDELVEITPKSIRIRKRHLKEHERKKASRDGA